MEKFINVFKMQFSINENLNLKDLPPHTWGIAAKALKELFSKRKRQAIAISGESGSGKTETAKIAMTFLTAASRLISKSGTENIEDKVLFNQIIACNPVLEAFGNAKTVKNYNSSRFGKFVLMFFDLNKKTIIGAMTKQYLLEKSRVTKIVS